MAEQAVNEEMAEDEEYNGAPVETMGENDSPTKLTHMLDNIKV